MTANRFARARSLRADMPEVVAAMKRGRGRPRLANAKVRVSLRLDPAVLDAFRRTGPGWQARIAAALARAAGRLSPRSHRSRAG
jgi:uncharacterized protein (DUF4415 family)